MAGPLNPGSYLNSSSLFNSGAASVAGADNGDLACGKSFTTAPPDYVAATKVNGVTEVKTRNPETGAIQYRILTDQGAHIGIDESGAICLFSAFSPPDDKKTGQFKQRCAGKYMLKVGNEAHIEIENKEANEVALSIIVYGNVNVESKGGSLNLGGDNVTITAADSMTLNAGRTIQLNSGQGSANSPTSAASKLNGVDTGSAGGKIELNAGEIIQKSSAKTSNVNVTYENISSERALEMKDSRGTFKISSLGHMEFDVRGDYIEKIIGKRKTSIFGSSTTVPHPDAPKTAAWEVEVGKQSDSEKDFSLVGFKGDFYLDSKKGKFNLETSKEIKLNSKKGGFFEIGLRETVLYGNKDLVVRSKKIAQFGVDNGNYLQTDGTGTKVNAKTIYLN